MIMDDEPGPLLLAPDSYFQCRALIRKALGFPYNRRPLLIGIDGVDGCGKSSLAAWLSWQLEMPAIHLDIFMIPDSSPLTWRYQELACAINGAQLGTQRPVIVEGVLLLYVLEQISRTPDFLAFVEKDQHTHSMRKHVDPYLDNYEPCTKATYRLRWSSAEHDAQVRQAHHARGDGGEGA
jgi:hypothetical protein